MTRGNRARGRSRASRASRPIPTRVRRGQRSSTSSTSGPPRRHDHFSRDNTSQSTPGQEQSTAPPPHTIELNNYEYEDNDGILDHVIMALNRSGTASIGCAYYVAREATLYCMEDLADPDANVISSLKYHAEPTIILTSPKIDLDEEHDMSARLSSQSSENITDNDSPQPPHTVELRPNADFGYEQALKKLAGLQTLTATPDVRFLVPGQATEYGEQLIADEYGMSEERGQMLHVSGFVNLSSNLSIGCAGAIITYLQRKTSSEYLQGDSATVTAYAISKLEMFTLKGVMMINSDTMSALQIFQPESLPYTTKRAPCTSGSKDSLSVYGLFYHFARTPHGKAQLRRWFLQPSLDLELIKQRHDAVSVLSRADNQAAAQSLSKSLGRIKNMRRVVVTLHKGIEGGNQNCGRIKSGIWSALLEFCYHALDISETIREIINSERLPLCQKLLQSLSRTELRLVGKMIHEVVDLEESQEQQRTVIKRNVAENLDKIKDAYDSMDEMLQRTAIEIVRDLPPAIEAPPLNVIYFPQLGFHITVPLEPGSNVPIYDGMEVGWEQMFTTDSQAYFKNEKMRRMDEHLGDLYAMICDIEIEISHQLAQDVLKRELLLINASDLCGELDCILALAHGAREHKLSRPYMVEENVISIKAGRHFLQQCTVPAFIPNDAHLQGGDLGGTTIPQIEHESEPTDKAPNMILLTGPNYSGKSVYLKQIALIVYLAQVGSFVPAEFARLGITDKILSRITTRETVSRASSTFMIDLQQISSVLNSCTSRSLLVIDEFGKGTDSCDGAGLMAGVLHQLLSLGEVAPKSVASTHFHEIFEITDLENFSNVQFCHMEVRIDQPTPTGGKRDLSQVTYLYNLIPGRSTVSFGTQCAAMSGIPEAVVARATELSDFTLRGEDLISICSAISCNEYEELTRAEQLCRSFLTLDVDACDDETRLQDFLAGVDTGSLESDNCSQLN